MNVHIPHFLVLQTHTPQTLLLLSPPPPPPPTPAYWIRWQLARNFEYGGNVVLTIHWYHKFDPKLAPISKKH